jgi:hypothetical protein
MSNVAPKAIAMTPLNFDDLESAFYWVSGAGPFENAAFVSRVTGQVYWISEETQGDEEVPDDIEDGTLYIAVPHKNDLDLGRSLVFEFAEDFLPNEIHKVRSFFSKRGAYSRFKDLLEYKNLLERWYEFERDATEKALHRWAKENGFELSAPIRKAGN